MRLDAHAICEKPLVISPWNLDQLELLEVVWKPRIHGSSIAPSQEAQRLKQLVEAFRWHFECNLHYVTRRGPWYHQSWKGQASKSGGLSMNIGINFDLLIWLFGPVAKSESTVTNRQVQGRLQLDRATVNWYLSIDVNDLPDGHLAKVCMLIVHSQSAMMPLISPPGSTTCTQKFTKKS